MTDAPRRMTRVAAYARTGAWIPRSELPRLPLVELAEVGVGLAFDAP